MKITVSTGQTKAPHGTILAPVALGEGSGDRVFFLMHSEGKAEGSENLREECMSILTHAVIEAEGSGYDRLESALKELNGLLKGFLLSETVRDVHAVVGLLEAESNTLHISNVGRAEAYIIRDATASQITEYSRGKAPSAFMHIVSGPVHSRDHFIISTQRLLRTITPAELVQIVQHGGETIVQTIISKLSAEKEVACIAHIAIHGSVEEGTATLPKNIAVGGRSKRGASQAVSLLSKLRGKMSTIDLPSLKNMKISAKSSRVKNVQSTAGESIRNFLKDLYDPERKRRAHLFLLAGSATAFLLVWMLVQLSLSSQRSQTRGELSTLVKQINADIATAENRQLTGETDSANMSLQRAEETAQKVMMNESGLFKSEALDLLEKIKSKREEINRIVRVVPPRIMANLGAKKSDILAQGFLGLPNGEFLAFDKHDLYRISLNTVENGERLVPEEIILDGVDFPRFQSKVFMTTGNSVIEMINGQPTTMKTEDSAGWITGADLKTYLRYLYVLAPERKQIYKYERLASKYGPPAEYNVNGDLSGALDMSIVGPVYVLRDVSVSGGKPGQRDVTKLLRGEKQTFNIRNLPPGALNGVTKIFKSSPTGNFYFLDPENKRIVVTTSDGDLGDSLYLKQYILDSEQVGKLKDLYVDSDDSRLYVLDEKKLYAIDLQSK